VIARLEFQKGLPANVLADSHLLPGPLLPALFASPIVGVAVLDSQMRYRAVNKALAAMNGVPAARHAGRRPSHVFGNVASKVEGAIDHVLGAGMPVSLDLKVELPSRQGVGHWTESFSPIRDTKGRVTQVIAVILEITERKDLQRSLNHLVGSLLNARMAEGHADEQSELLAQSVELAQHCISEVQALCKGPSRQTSVELPQMQRLDVTEHSRSELGVRPLSPRERSVLQHLADGKSNKEVGALLGITVRTAEGYRARLMKKVGIYSLAHLVRFAVRNRIIEA
jgi:PAS domain S-box-containing protein